jgi:hypothetical protein
VLVADKRRWIHFNPDSLQPGFTSTQIHFNPDSPQPGSNSSIHIEPHGDKFYLFKEPQTYHDPP